ncbi:MAG: hypothetical protein HOK30_25495 [Rhodospirillaceae bacterium]|jgi:phospholipid-binding lipoprotein MlaA|nr:hypothetical protein [Rhodospirillaceae bacterium]MBT5894871.1 hypothetical protein [Rhodospirillaceae bacterium]MBT6431048.1 hypothetical protein [Rhodospirillaceae bacterium]MBT7756811.1 hypothetical protein [Rhodospirillaceae bacterium]
MRGFLAAAILVAGLFGPGWAMAQDQAGLAAGFQNYFAATAQNAGIGARNEAIRHRQVRAVLSPQITRFLVQRPGQINPMIRGLAAAVPDIAPTIINEAMTAFPGFANQIAMAAGYRGAPVARATTYARQRFRASPRAGLGRHQVDAHAARVAAWASSAIARNPRGLDQIMAQALAAAPGGEVAVVRAVQAAYPGFESRIAAATGVVVGARPGLTTPRSMYRPTQTVRMTTPRAVVVQPGMGQPGIGQPTAAKPAVVQPVIVQPIVQRRTAASQSPQPRPATEPLPPGLRLADADEEDGGISDPLEPMNRIIFAFNDTVDLILLRPIAIGYNAILPDVVIQSVRRFFLNLDAPVILANDLLQGDFRDAGVTVGRFGVNSTIGLMGLFDPAARFGWERHHADFGQTLHAYDVGAGPYLVLPLLGPVSTRGGVGKVTDIFFQPLTYLLTTVQNLAIGATRAVVRREELLNPLDELRENSVDYYTGLKAAFWQARQIELNKGALSGLGDGGADKLFDATN